RRLESSVQRSSMAWATSWRLSLQGFISHERAPKSVVPTDRRFDARDCERGGGASREEKTRRASLESPLGTARPRRQPPRPRQSALSYVIADATRSCARRQTGRSARVERENLTAETTEVLLDAPENHAPRQRQARRHWEERRVIDQAGQSRDDHGRRHAGAALVSDEAPHRASKGGLVDRPISQRVRDDGAQVLSVGKILDSAKYEGVPLFSHDGSCGSTSGLTKRLGDPGRQRTPRESQRERNEAALQLCMNITAAKHIRASAALGAYEPLLFAPRRRPLP